MLVHIRRPLARLLLCLVAVATVPGGVPAAEPADTAAPEAPAPEEPATDTDSPLAVDEPSESDPLDAPLPPDPAADTATDTADAPEEMAADEAPLPPEAATDDGPLTVAAEGPSAADTESADAETADTDAAEPMIDSTADADSDADAAEADAAAESVPAPVEKPAAGTAPQTVAAPQAPAKRPAPPKTPVLVPGSGALVKGIGDDFEDETWKWNYNHPKSSEEQDKRVRGPMGRSVNSRWFEGPKRGTPDVVKRIALPAPGLEGSAHGLLIATLNAGIPGRTTYQMQQDDLIYNMQKVTGRGIPVGDSPSVVTRVYVPPFAQWEKRNGPTFGFRAGCYTHAIITGEDHPDRGKFGLEEYWPGMFICFEPANPKKKTADSAYLRIRGGRNGGEIRGPQLDVDGWWTLGLSCSPDGMVHYFASPGVDDLTMDDHITSQYPYGYRTEWMKTFFFNVCTKDDGKTWSTPWVIDDPQVFFIKRQLATTPPAAPKVFRKR